MSKTEIKFTSSLILETMERIETKLDSLLSKTISKIFKKPTIEEIQSYLDKKNYNDVDAEKFWTYYESVDWMVGKKKMKNWGAACATWHKNNCPKLPKQETHVPTDKEKYEADYEDILTALRKGLKCSILHESKYRALPPEYKEWITNLMASLKNKGTLHGSWNFLNPP